MERLAGGGGGLFLSIPYGAGGDEVLEDRPRTRIVDRPRLADASSPEVERWLDISIAVRVSLVW